MTDTSVATDIDALRAALIAADDAAKRGESIDLTGTDERVAAICKAIEAMETARARPLLADLTALLARLEAVSVTLKAPSDLMAGPAAEASPHRHRDAAAAYGGKDGKSSR